MKTEFNWIETPSDGRLAVMPRPRGGDWLEDEMRSWREAGADVVVSLLTPDEVTHFDLVHEAEYSQCNGMLFWSSPVADRDIPTSTESFTEFVTLLSKLVESGKKVVVHCRQGIGRSALAAVAVLVTMGVAFDEAIERVSRARGLPVPETSEQRQWLKEFAIAQRVLTA